MKFYCAGKIAKNDWRHTLVPELRSTSGEMTYKTRSHGHIPCWPEAIVDGLWGEHDYVGPFFLGDDHGCLHGAGTHGVGLGSWCCPRCHELQDIGGTWVEDYDRTVPMFNGHLMGWPERVLRCQRCGELSFSPEPIAGDFPSGCIGEGPPLRQHIVSLCWHAIQRCDVLFAWLDDPTAYGSLVEIGWAHALQKPVWIASPTWLPDLWFAYTLATQVRIGLDPDPGAALRELLVRYEWQQQVKAT